MGGKRDYHNLFTLTENNFWRSIWTLKSLIGLELTLDHYYFVFFDILPIKLISIYTPQKFLI